MSQFSTLSAYSAPPITPSPASPGLLSSPSTLSLSTPPDSIRKYSTALKAMMAQGMSAAMADAKDEARLAERQFDVEFGYDDEDPIERHMKLSLTPRKVPKVPSLAKPIEEVGVGAGAGGGARLHVEEDKEELMEDIQEQREARGEEEVQPFRPGLLHFNRSSRRSIPLFNRNDSMNTSGTSTPNHQSGSEMFDTDTPGSEWSEASFEAIKAEDVLSMYGTSASSLSATNTDRSSLASTMSTATICHATMIPVKGTPSRPSLGRRKRSHPYPAPPGKEIGSTAGIEESDEEWLAGRTKSEQMVAKAGIRCQRGRNQRGVAR